MMTQLQKMKALQIKSKQQQEDSWTALNKQALEIQSEQSKSLAF